MIEDEKKALRRLAAERRAVLAREAGPGHGEALQLKYL